MPKLTKNHLIIIGIVTIIIIGSVSLGVVLGYTSNDQPPSNLSDLDNQDTMNCIVCTGPLNQCVNGDNGISKLCPISTVACTNTTSGAKQHRACGPVNTLISPMKMNKCVPLNILGEEKV